MLDGHDEGLLADSFALGRLGAFSYEHFIRTHGAESVRVGPELGLHRGEDAQRGQGLRVAGNGGLQFQTTLLEVNLGEGGRGVGFCAFTS